MSEEELKKVYQATFRFLMDYWIRDGKPNGSFSDLLSSMSPSDDIYGSSDPAMYSDWKKLVLDNVESNEG